MNTSPNHMSITDENVLTDQEIEKEVNDEKKRREIQRQKEKDDRLRENLIKEYAELNAKKLRLDQQAMQAGMQDLRVQNEKLKDLFKIPILAKNNTTEVGAQQHTNNTTKIGVGQYTNHTTEIGAGQHTNDTNDKSGSKSYHSGSQGRRRGLGHGRGDSDNSRSDYNSDNSRSDYDGGRQRSWSQHSGNNSNKFGRGKNNNGHGGNNYEHGGTHNRGISRRPLSNKRMVRKLEHDIIQIKKKQNGANKHLHVHNHYTI